MYYTFSSISPETEHLEHPRTPKGTSHISDPQFLEGLVQTYFMDGPYWAIKNIRRLTWAMSRPIYYIHEKSFFNLKYFISRRSRLLVGYFMVVAFPPIHSFIHTLWSFIQRLLKVITIGPAAYSKALQILARLQTKGAPSIDQQRRLYIVQDNRWNPK